MSDATSIQLLATALILSSALLALAMGPVADIAALRETSIVFAALLGTYILGEPFGRKRVNAALAAAAGIALMYVGR